VTNHGDSPRAPREEALAGLYKLARDWLKDAPGATSPTAQTPAYVDLIFAFGLARLGEGDAARDLLARARLVLGDKDEAHRLLCGVFEYRVRQALDGKPHTGPLPDDQLEYLERMDRLLRYVVDRLRKHSWILEPDQRINPYRHWGARISEFEKALAELTDLTDRAELARRVEKLLAEVPEGPAGAEARARVIRAGLEAASRAGEDFARRMLEQAIPAYDALPETKELAQLTDRAAFLEKALFVAGHFGQAEAVGRLVSRFRQMLQPQTGPQALQLLSAVAAQCCRGLWQLGMREEFDQVLRQVAEVVLGGQEVKAIDFKQHPQGPAALQALLQVASWWYFLGQDGQAEAVAEAVWDVLLDDDLTARDLMKKEKLSREESTELNEHARLACSYVRAVGQAPAEVAQRRLEEVFRQLKGITDSYTTSDHFSVSQLDLVESVVLAVVGSRERLRNGS
jgi:hypothetical protein